MPLSWYASILLYGAAKVLTFLTCSWIPSIPKQRTTHHNFKALNRRPRGICQFLAFKKKKKFDVILTLAHSLTCLFVHNLVPGACVSLGQHRGKTKKNAGSGNDIGSYSTKNTQTHRLLTRKSVTTPIMNNRTLDISSTTHGLITKALKFIPYQSENSIPLFLSIRHWGQGRSEDLC